MIDIDCSEWAILRFIGASFVLWLCYYLLFDRKAPFNQCRNYLLFSVLLAGAVSVVRIPVYPVEVVRPIKMERVVVKQETQMDKTSLVQVENDGIQPDTLAAVQAEVSEAIVPRVEEEIAEEPFYASWDYWQIVWIVYGLGVFVLLMHLLVEMARIWRLKRWGSCTMEADGICIVRNNEVVSPFSFYRMIFINRKLEGEVLRIVLLHEKAHIRNHHYRDTLFIEGLSILCWFNPFVWLVKRELRALHEFQVDRCLLSGEIELFEYQSILFEELMGYSPKVANGFHNSLIKKRFIMMKHQYKERFAGVRKIALLPLCAGVLALFSFTEKPVLIEPVLPMVSVSMKAETPEVVSNEKKMDSVGDEKCFLLLDSPKIVHYIQSGEAHLVKSGSSQLLAKVTTPVSKMLDTLSEEKPNQTSLHGKEADYTVGVDLPADQVVLSRAPYKRSIYVRFIERTKEDTRVTLAIPIYYDRHWLQFETGLSIVDEDTKDVYKIRSLTRGIELNQTYWVVGQEKQMLEFTLVFPPLDRKVKKISIRDCFPEERGLTPPNGSSWRLENLKVDDFLPTAARIAEYDREGRPLRSDKLEEVTLNASQLAVSSRRGDGKSRIQKIETLPEKTLVVLNIPIHFDRHWLVIGKGLCLVDSRTGDEYPILEEAHGIEMNKLLWVEGCEGRSVLLTLVFPKLPKKVKTIDLYNKYPDAGVISPSNGSSWDWRKVKIKDYQKEPYKRIIL